MPKRGNTGNSNQSRRGQGILSDVDQQKRQKFKTKLQEFRTGREWDKDSYQQDLKDLNNTIETVEELITDIQVDIRKLEGRGDYTGEVERIKQDYGKSELEELKSKGSGEFTPFLKEISDVYKELSDLKDRRQQWIAYQALLQEIAKDKMKGVADKFKSDYADSEIASRLLDYLEKNNEHFQNNLEKDLKSMIREQFSEAKGDISQLEIRVEKAENKADRAVEEAEKNKELAKAAVEALKEEVGSEERAVKELKTEIQKIETSQSPEPVQPEEKPVKSSGTDEGDRPQGQIEAPKTESKQSTGIDTDEVGEQFDEVSQGSDVEDEPVQETEEDEEAEEAPDDDLVEEVLDEEASEKDVDPEELEVEIRGKSTDEQYEALKNLRAKFGDEEWKGFSQADIADMTDASRPYLVNEILRGIYDEYDTAFEITSRFD